MSSMRGCVAIRMSVAFIACSLCLSGCREQHIPVYFTEGEVFIRGAPAAGALIVLKPLEGAPGEHDFPSGFPRGLVDPSGHFVLSTFADADGAPAGTYVPLIRWPRGRGSAEDPETAESLRDGPSPSNSAGGWSAARSFGHVTIQARRRNVLPRFELR